jgi:hypothetical protein
VTTGKALHKRRHRLLHAWRPTVLFAGLFVLVCLLGMLFRQQPATYSISAVSEIATIAVNDERGIAAKLPVVSIRRQNADSESARPICCSATLEVARGVRLSLARKRSGDLLIQLSWPKDLRDAARIVTSTGTLVPLESGDVLRVSLSRPIDGGKQTDDPDTVLIAFRGELRLGDDVGPRVDRTLLSGSVKIVERETLSEKRYVVYETTLDPGDAVEWHGDANNQPVTVSGFLHVGSDEAMTVVAYGSGRYMSVYRYGAPTYEITPSGVDRLARDPLLNATAIAFASASALTLVFDIIIKAFKWAFRRRPEPGDAGHHDRPHK